MNLNRIEDQARAMVRRIAADKIKENWLIDFRLKHQITPLDTAVTCVGAIGKGMAASSD